MLLPINIDNLSSYLKPPSGCRFDKGLSTTYSLHLDVLLTIPMFLDGALSEKNAVLQNYQAVVLMINSLRNKFKVYVQKGEIKTSPLAAKKASKLYELLRDMIEEMPRDSKDSSFHPKMWLLKYVAPDNSSKYKLIILSKNLTNSKDLDIAVVFDGKESEEAHKSINTKIYNFIYETLKDDRFTKDELEKIEWQNIDGFTLDDILFLPNDTDNVPFMDGNNLNNKMIVFSPFLGKNIFAKNNKNILVTREEEIDAQICKDIYKVNESLNDENAYEDEVLELFEKDGDTKSKNLINQLHAKIYVYTKNRNNWLSFGSTNASNRGFKKNDEVLITLKASKGFYNQIKNYIEDEKRKVFVRANVIKNEEEIAERENKQKILSKIDEVKNILLQDENILKVKYKDKKLKATLKSVELSAMTMTITPVSKVEFKNSDSNLEWDVIESQITGWFIFSLSLDGYSREFLLEDKTLKIYDEYKKAIEKEAIDNSQSYFDTNIFALLSDGNIGLSHLVQEHKEESDSPGHCYSNTIDDGIVDLMFNRYATSQEVYKSVYKLLSQNEKYKDIVNILPKI